MLYSLNEIFVHFKSEEKILDKNQCNGVDFKFCDEFAPKQPLPPALLDVKRFNIKIIMQIVFNSLNYVNVNIVCKLLMVS